MEPLEVKIFGYSLYMNIPPEKLEYYRAIADKLNRLMLEEASKSDAKSDIKTAIKVAFIMANESNIYRSQIDALTSLVDQLEVKVNAMVESENL